MQIENSEGKMSAIRDAINTYYVRTGNKGSSDAALAELDQIIRVLERMERAGEFDNGDKKCVECGAWEYEHHAEDCELHNLVVKLGVE